MFAFDFNPETLATFMKCMLQVGLGPAEALRHWNMHWCRVCSFLYILATARVISILLFIYLNSELPPAMLT